MCGRSSLTKVEKEIELRFNATFYSEELERYNPLPNYNVAPTHLHPVITSSNPQRIQLFRWGLIPSWASDKKNGAKMINARLETLMEKAVFKNAVQSRRCIVPLDGFFEWKKNGKEKIPFRIVTTDQEIFSVAGLWDTWKDPQSGEFISSFSIITHSPNSLVGTIHDRMPAILEKQNEHLWLDESIHPNDAITLLHPYAAEDMMAYEVSPKVNNVNEKDPSVINSFTKKPSPIQTSLF